MILSHAQPDPTIDTPSTPPVPGVIVPPTPNEEPPGDQHPIGEPEPSNPDDPARKPAIM